MPPPNNASYMPTARGDEFSEVDIFVPSAPTAPPGGGGNSVTKQNNNKMRRGNVLDDDDDRDDPSSSNAGGSGGGGGDMGSSYADLVAKFESLQK